MGSTKVYTHPHWETSVIDRSIYRRLTREILPLLRPIFFMRTQSGPSGVPVWVNTYTEAVNTFGEGTFDINTPYYSREALFCTHLFARQGCFIVRMSDASARRASFVLELRVKRTEVQQYETDTEGYYILDENDEKVPMIDSATGAAITEPGVELKWTIRPMKLDGLHPETQKNLRPTTHTSADGEYTVYPMMSAVATSVGAFGNDTGIKFYVDTEDVDDVLASNINALPYVFGAVKKSYGTDTVAPIYDLFSNKIQPVVIKEDQMDTRVDRRVSFDDIIGNYWTESNPLPFDVKVYADNFKTVGEIIMEYEEDDDTLTDPFMVNLAENLNIHGIPMKHVTFSEDDDAISLVETRILYLMNGADGKMDDESIEALHRQYLKDKVYPEIFDQARYPFTHMFDTGVSIQTKKIMIQFLGMHDAFKVVLSTQSDLMGRYNTKAEDLSCGSSLYAACLLQPESTIKGTECCRAEIYQQAGILNDSQYKGIVPATLDAMLKKSQYMSTTSITGHPGGLPNSLVTIFKDWNWTPCDADHKERSWEIGLNYFQYCDMKRIHYPSLRTVYRYDTSVLSSSQYTDVVVFVKHMARYNWARYAGVELPFSQLAAKAASSLTTDMSLALGNRYPFTVEYYQTEEDAKIGYQSHARVKLWGDPQSRVHLIEIECYRSGFDPDAVEDM